MTHDKSKMPLGVMLKNKGLINQEQIDFAIQEQGVTREKIGEILERLCFVTEYDVITTLSDQESIPYIDVNEIAPKEEALKLFNKKFCITNQFLPLYIEAGSLEVAASSVSNARLAQAITRQTGLTPKFYIAEKNKIINAINKFYYFVENPVEKLIDREVGLLSKDHEMVRGTDRLIDNILHLAVKMRATDIHIRPLALSTNISFRVDGVMTSVLSLPSGMSRIISGFKLKADMDIAEQRLPQDGRFSETILNNGYDFRVSTIVSSQGENMVIRVLPMESAILGMAQLGFYEEHISLVQQMFNEPFGIILLTGPTGSGKSTTLYAGIRRLNLLQKNVLTVEDPIEYDIPLLRQTQVNEKAGYTFASAIRYFLRHDPDVILIGEIRDSETAATAVTASSTGHLVLSTLHTNSAVSAIPRLKDLGVKSFLLADSLIGVVSQRLVRKICNVCKEPYAPSEWEKEYLKDPSIKELYKGRGCDACNGSGYFGRTLVYEILTINKELAILIDQDSDLSLILEKARQAGFAGIRDITVAKVKEGITTTGEAVRVLGNIRQF
ncbi:MAG: type II/IV secretion system protein [Deltaproteobacteria bacterium]|nr:type II/IV secretion system protein [Deltaproteobacteria bacterium]